MRNVGLVTDLRFRGHDPGPNHPECPERLEALEGLFALPKFSGLPRVAAREAGEEEIGRVHTAELLHAVAASAGNPRTQFDADTSASAGSFEAACLAAGGAIELADAVQAGDLDAGFAAVRPPGHHAERDRAMGFCFFNNVAIVANHLRARHGLERILIVDWDVHHGNGTQQTFYDDPGVMYASLHQYPFYPGTGSPDEVGGGAGAGYTVNVPMRAGSGNDDYLASFRDIILPAARLFAPEFVLVSAGYDAHRDDPLASISVDEDGYAQMTRALVGLADEQCGGRLVCLLEGGYSLEALVRSVRTTLETLELPAPFDAGSSELGQWGRQTKEIVDSYWNKG
jgi:acetoin utilization deacetylase AcuC-like enzyme